MAKTYKFSKKNKNRYRKVYNYIRKKPKYEYCVDEPFTLVVGHVEFENSSGPVTFTFPIDATFINVPIITALSVDSIANDSADVNVFISAVTTTSVQFETSAPFTGQVNFHIISQD